MSGKRRHEWRFFRAGDFDQVRIDTAADLLALDQLDQKLWVALSCPTRGLEFDSHTLDMIDSDKDGHVRAPEVIAAVQWAAGLLKEPALLAKGASALPLDAIDDSTAEGAKLLAAARHILLSLGRAEADSVSPEDTCDTSRLMAGLPFNGDGVILPASVGDEGLQGVAQAVMDCAGSVTDNSGEPGISAALVGEFFSQARALDAWQQRAEQDGSILFMGEATLGAAAAWRAVRAKVNDYFTRCQLAAYDERAVEPLSRSAGDYLGFAARELTATMEEVAAFPLAKVAAGQGLPLRVGINPAWNAAIATLREQVVVPLLGERDVLSEAEWQSVSARFEAVEGWLADKPQTAVAGLDVARVREMLAGDAESRLLALTAQDAALAEEVAAIAAVDRLVHYVRDLPTLLNNFVSFRNFYSAKEKAIFQAGTLYLDGRSCELCIKVDNIAKHATLADLSRVCLVYCECTRGAERMNIAAAFMAGDSDQLMVGRNGVFYDRKGQDWNATIVRILEHPISIRQAFWSPYKRASKMVGEQIQKFAAARSQAAEAKLVTTALESGKQAVEAPKAPPAPFDVGKFAGVFAAIGLAVGALGTALASVLTGLLGLAWWQLPLVVLGALLAVSGPSMLLAWFKLKQRNLGPILDANGWAVNARARINISFGTALTAVAALPPGSSRELVDPYADKKRVWPYWLLLAIVVAGAYWWFVMNGSN
jgi:hypothetical protein